VAPVGQLSPISPDFIDDTKTLFEQLFNGPLPGILDGDHTFPLFAGRDNLVDKANEMVDTFNSNRWRYPAYFILMAKGAVEKVLDVLPKLIETIDYALDHYTPVISLYRAGSGWTREVMTPVSEITGSINRDLDKVGLDWEDRAREIYSGDIVPHQHDAAGAVRDNAAYISNMLSEIGTANTDYATDVVEKVAEVYAQLVVVIAELASLIGSPFAIQDAAGLIEKGITSFVGVVTAAVDSFAAAVERIQNAENELSNHTYFPGGEWPQAVSRA
jgi:hypothetical protein